MIDDVNRLKIKMLDALQFGDAAGFNIGLGRLQVMAEQPFDEPLRREAMRALMEIVKRAKKTGSGMMLSKF